MLQELEWTKLLRRLIHPSQGLPAIMCSIWHGGLQWLAAILVPCRSHFRSESAKGHQGLSACPRPKQAVFRSCQGSESMSGLASDVDIRVRAAKMRVSYLS